MKQIKLANGIENASHWLGRDVPEVYLGALSEYVLAAGCKLLKEWQPDVMYLSTTDYVQLKLHLMNVAQKNFMQW